MENFANVKFKRLNDSGSILLPTGYSIFRLSRPHIDQISRFSRNGAFSLRSKWESDRDTPNLIILHHVKNFIF